MRRRAPKYDTTVTITTPPEPVVDPATGRETTAAPVVVPDVPARLSQSPVAVVGSQNENRATQNTTVTSWTLLVPPGTALTSRSTVLDVHGRLFAVEGEPADRPNTRPQFRAASLRLISDLQ